MPLNELPAGALLAPQVDGTYRYRVDALIGAGGFGITYLAEDARLGGKVVIKELACDAVSVRNTDAVTIRPAHGREEPFHRLVRKFRDEVHLLHRIHSPHVVRVLDFFDQNGTTYYAMARINAGGKLGETRFDGSIDSAAGQKILTQFGQLLDALEAVHEAGIIHGDVKPDNVLIDAKGSVVLIDFGTARQTIDLDRTATSASHTPGYAPPELTHRSRSREVGPYSDFYSWAMMLYGALLPHPDGSDGYPLDAYIRERNDPYGDIEQALRVRGLPARWAGAVAACLRVTPSERPASVAAVRAALESTIQGGTSAESAALQLSAPARLSRVATVADTTGVTNPPATSVWPNSGATTESPSGRPNQGDGPPSAVRDATHSELPDEHVARQPNPSAVPRTIEDQLLADASEETKGARKSIALPPRRKLGLGAGFIVVIAGVIVGFVAYFATYTYYTTRAVPSVVQDMARAIETQFTVREAELQDALAEFREQRESQLRTYETNGTMLPSDLERVRLQVNRQIEQRQAETNADIDRARVERDNDLGSHGETGAAAAAKLATIAGAIVGLLALAIGGGVLAVRRRKS